jgi:hypothetical protein
MSQELTGNGGEKDAFFVICSDDFLVLGSLCESIWPTFPQIVCMTRKSMQEQTLHAWMDFQSFSSVDWYHIGTTP